MAKERTKTVQSWDELIRFIESININKKTIVLSGWICKEITRYDNTVKFPIKKLTFSTKSIEILRGKK